MTGFHAHRFGTAEIFPSSILDAGRTLDDIDQPAGSDAKVDSLIMYKPVLELSVSSREEDNRRDSFRLATTVGCCGCANRDELYFSVVGAVLDRL